MPHVQVGMWLLLGLCQVFTVLTVGAQSEEVDYPEAEVVSLDQELDSYGDYGYDEYEEKVYDYELEQPKLELEVELDNTNIREV